MTSKRASIKDRGLDVLLSPPTQEHPAAAPEPTTEPETAARPTAGGEAPVPPSNTAEPEAPAPSATVAEPEAPALPQKPTLVEKAGFYLPRPLLDDLHAVWRAMNQDRRRRADVVTKSDLVREILEEGLRQRKGALGLAEPGDQG
jgi:hypothetical protein